MKTVGSCLVTICGLTKNLYLKSLDTFSVMSSLKPLVFQARFRKFQASKMTSSLKLTILLSVCRYNLQWLKIIDNVYFVSTAARTGVVPFIFADKRANY
jgi:hypothetical protein